MFLISGQDCNSGMQKRIHFRTDMELYICGPVNNSDISLGYQFCKNITFILYIYNVTFKQSVAKIFRRHNRLRQLQNINCLQSESKLINGVAGKTTGHVILI